MPMSSPPSRRRLQRVKERGIELFLLLCGVLSIFTTLGIVAVLVVETVGFFQEVSLWDFLGDTQWTPLFAEKRFGIWPLLGGTALVSAIAMLVALPVGLLVALYLSDWAPSGVRAWVKPVLEILAGIPTVVYGYFALLTVTPLLQRLVPGLDGFNALSPGLVMGVMILPMMASLSEDALRAVPRGLREAGYALGSTRLQVSLRVVLPSALSGITAASILAVSRAIGETMIVTIAAGQQARLTLDPLGPVETMTAYIVQVSLGDTPAGTLEYRTIFVVGMMLFLSTLLLNLVSFRLRARYREEYQ